MGVNSKVKMIFDDARTQGETKYGSCLTRESKSKKIANRPRPNAR